jgi:riboflavin synthase
MFTGLVEGLGRIVEVRPGSGSSRIGIATPLVADGVELGDSVAVDGVCLTACALDEGHFWADVVAETLDRTNLSSLEAGRDVNLERSLRVGDRLGGHLVQGHVDATAPVAEVRSSGDDWRLRVGLVPTIRRYVAWKGSIALQGVSLTVAALDDDGFEVALVPQTLERTTLGRLTPGDLINVEVDLVARYLERLVAGREDGVGQAPTGDLG